MELFENTSKRNDIEETLVAAGIPCVSVIVSTNKLPAEKDWNRQSIKNAVERTKELLQVNFPDTAAELVKRINEQLQRIDFSHMDQGLGIYVSPKVGRLVTFAFPVKDRISVHDHFSSRELLYNINTVIEYYVISISKKYIRLFKGRGEELREIRNSDFPMVNEDNHEYAHPSRAISYASEGTKGYEREKSQIQEIRLKDLLRKADQALNKYIQSLPLLTSGGKKEIADFEEVTKHGNQVIGKIPLHIEAESELGKLAWEQITEYTGKRNTELVNSLRELVGKKLAVTGIHDVRQAAKEGKGLELVLEKDFAPEHEKNQSPFAEEEVENIIRMVLEKRGKVIFVENGQMNGLGGIALRLRYE